MTTKRCFAFGCSFTNWFYPTWADFIGYNYDEFYNYGKGATSNHTSIMRFIEADNIHNFNEDDLILVGLTGIGRCNFFVDRPDGTTGLWGAGDLEVSALDEYITTVKKWEPYLHIIRFMRDQYWNRKWGIYQTWMALKTIKKICSSNNIKHIIIPGLDISLYFDKESLGLEQKEVNMMNDIYNMLDVKVSIQEYHEKNYNILWEDQHPFINGHFDYIKTYLPNYVTTKNTEYYEKMHNEVKGITDKQTAYNLLSNYKSNIAENTLWQKLYGEYT